jgi:2-polyprenyl-6-methoxyphenol hydroxylase-like FAD-dependent oxidoreductase
MKVLISGAGPAGLTAAYWLKRYGYNPTIVERAPSLLVGGYKIDVRGAALQVIKQMGIHGAALISDADIAAARVLCSGNIKLQSPDPNLFVASEKLPSSPCRAGALANGAKWEERHARRVGITTREECFAVERSGQLP